MAHLLDVIGQAGEELSGLRLVVVTEAEALDAGEELVAQVEGHPLRGALGEVALQEVEETPPDRDTDQGAYGPEHR